ncbi:MAG TPA: RDD family protein [Tepidisphaeraceae bacterium]|jgi:uncharacterized RDD family membrane protein YckC
MVLVLALAVFAPRAAARAAQAPYDLLAHGNLNALWIGEVRPPLDPTRAGSRTVFRARTAGDFANWQYVGEVAARAVQLSDRGSELIVLLDNGDWMMLSETSARSGVALPGQGNIVAIAGDAEAVWAIGADQRAATQPAPSPARPATSASVSTGPAAPTAPALPATTQSARNGSVGLFNLAQGDWVYQSPLPPGVRRNDVASMVLLNHRPLLAYVDRNHTLNVISFTTKGWDTPQALGPIAPDAHVSLLNLGNQPVAAVEDQGGVSIYVASDKWTGPVKLQPTGEMQQSPHQAVAAALGQLRILCSDGPRKLVEQPYNLDGQAAGKPFSATQQPAIAVDRIKSILIVACTLVFLIVMLGALTRRSAIAQAAERLEQLHLAPLGPRFAAGVIDATPLLLGLLLASPANASPDAMSHLTMPQILWLTAGLAVYVLHTAILEIVTGRSMGKMLFNLRVTNLDGNPPSAVAALSRNVLRIVDVILIFPLSLMIFLPLKQRLGDLAAGTLVARDPETERQEQEDES